MVVPMRVESTESQHFGDNADNVFKGQKRMTVVLVGYKPQQTAYCRNHVPSNIYGRVVSIRVYTG